MDNLGENLLDIPLPTYEGQRYEAEVPDTLDLAAVAELTIKGITNRIAEDKDYFMYTRDNFYADPPHLHFYWPNGANEGGCEGKHLEGLPLLRTICGSTLNEDNERGYLQSILRRTGQDGCFYLPPELYMNGDTPMGLQGLHTSAEREGRHILALCMRHQFDKNPTAKELIEKKIERLTAVAIYENDYAYFTCPSCPTAEVSFTPDDTSETLKDPSGGKGMFEDLASAHQVNFLLTRGLCVYYRISGYQPALELAGKLLKGVLEHRRGFEDDGRWIVDHFHTATASLLTILEYAMIKQDSELIKFVDRCYKFGKASGDDLTGYFPEVRPGSGRYLERRLCETCEVADMIGLAIKLTQAGAGDYWPDVERWVRNQFVENQMTAEKLHMLRKNLTEGKKQPIAPQKIDWMRKMLDNVNRQKALAEVTEVQVDTGTTCILQRPMKKEVGKDNDTVPYWMSLDIERAIGCFSGWAFPNDWGAMSMHGCCTGNASRTIYWIWDSILTKEDDLVRVNLLMNRASTWLDVDSYLPYEGRVVLKIKAAKKVAVRIPQWTDPEQVTCTVGGRECKYSWSGNYIVVDGLAHGDTVDIRFPMTTETVFRIIAADTTYTLTVKGYTVLDIEPKGRICPLYCRDAYKADVAPIKKVSCFISAKTIIW